MDLGPKQDWSVDLKGTHPRTALFQLFQISELAQFSHIIYVYVYRDMHVCRLYSYMKPIKQIYIGDGLSLWI